MRRLVVTLVVFATAIAAAAQWSADNQLHFERADGTEVVISPQAEPAGGVIVEFIAPPIAVAAKSAAKTAIDYQAGVTRFRNDLATIVNAKRAGKTAIDVQIREEYSVVFNGVALDAPGDVVEQLRALPYVKRVVNDRSVHALAEGASITVVNAPKVWSTLGSRGKGVTVAIIDTGIDYTHPALGGGFGPGFKVIGGWDFVNNDADPFDDNGHGTHVSGIVAGQSEFITGVAPEASLVAYKVLGAGGSGSDSNVIAAIERAADPNQDHNPSDHVDIANLSLGGTGNPDDPSSVAIDNATAVGVTFAIASGNNGAFHAISSPGTARSAITVGATDLTDKMASFSSRGPNMKNINIKPDVVAPGVGILSSYPGNRYATLSGTSMATPHVAGAAALLKSLHADWTPAQIKQALMNNAAFVQDDVMATGAGRIDVYAATTTSLAVEPPTLSLGLAPLDTVWTVTRTVHVTNRAAQSGTYTIKPAIGPGEKMTLSPASITLPAGGSADVTATITVDNAVTRTGTSSFSAGGQIVFTNAALATDVRNVPFAFTRAARATAKFDRAYPDAIWVSDSRTSIVGGAALDDNTSEALMFPGKWDMLIYTPERDPKTGAVTGVDFIAREGVTLTADTTINLTEADIPHTIGFSGRRENGQTLSGNGYASSGRILLGGTPGGFTALSFPWSMVHAMRFSDVTAGKTFLFYEMLMDTAENNYYMIQHPPLTGVSADASLTTGGAELRGGTVQIAMPAASRSDRRLSALGTTPSLQGGVAWSAIVDAPVINARVFVSPDTNPAYTYGVAFSAAADGTTQYTTPLLRVVNDRLVSLGSTGFLPWTHSGSSYQFGFGPRFPTSQFISTGPLRLGWTTDVIGPLGEVRVSDRSGTSTALFDAQGTRLLTSGYSTSIDLSTKAAYRLEAANQGTLYPGVNKTTTVSMTVDSTRADYIPPTVTTMMMLDGSGALATRLEPHGTGSLLFSAADFFLTSTGGRSYQPIRTDAVLSYRYGGETAWRPLSITQVNEDAPSGAGILYRAELGTVANIDRAMVDLKIDIADVAGNTTTVTMVPAFSVGPELLPKRRAAR
jgi:subtilisin family serine protease